MTAVEHERDELDELVEQIGDPPAILVAVMTFIRSVTYALALLPAAYGALTFAFGDDLWGGLPVYGTADQVPAAPQSWGVLALMMAGVMLVSMHRRRADLVCLATAIMTLWCFSFAVAFIVDAAQTGIPVGYAPTCVWGFASLIYAFRARLAWVQHQSATGHA